MTLLIIFLAMTNMAVGYGLAIYFGQVQLPVLTKLPRLRNRKAAAVIAVAAPTVPNATSDSLEPTDSHGVSEPDPAIEATKTAEPDAQSPPLVAAKQLDLSDLMPEAQSINETEELTREDPEKVAEADDPTEAESSEANSLAEVTANVGPAEIVESAVEVEPDQSEVAEPVLATSSATPTKEDVKVAVNVEVEAHVDGLDGEPRATKQNSPAEMTELAEEVAAKPAEESELATDPAADGAATEQVAEETTNELESLAQQLQIAMAEASDEGEIAEDITEGIAADEAAENEVVAEAELSQADAPAVSEYAPSGLESFQLQLQKPVEKNADEAVGAERQETSDINSPAIEKAPDEATGREGTEAFQARLQTQPQSTVREEESVLEGVAAFRSQLQAQQEVVVDATVRGEQAEDGSLEPEILEGIESFRSQLAKMKA